MATNFNWVETACPPSGLALTLQVYIPSHLPLICPFHIILPSGIRYQVSGISVGSNTRPYISQWINYIRHSSDVHTTSQQTSALSFHLCLQTKSPPLRSVSLALTLAHWEARTPGYAAKCTDIPTIEWEPVKNLWKTCKLSCERTCELQVFICFFTGFSQGVKFWKPVNRALFTGSKPVKNLWKNPVKKNSVWGAFSQGLKSQNLWTARTLFSGSKPVKKKCECSSYIRQPVKNNFFWSFLQYFFWRSENLKINGHFLQGQNLLKNRKFVKMQKNYMCKTASLSFSKYSWRSIYNEMVMFCNLITKDMYKNRELTYSCNCCSIIVYC